MDSQEPAREGTLTTCAFRQHRPLHTQLEFTLHILLVLQGACGGDTCCEEGNYNTGIAVARQTGEVYIANECPAGRVLHLDSNGNFLEVLSVGAYPSAVQVCTLHAARL